MAKKATTEPVAPNNVVPTEATEITANDGITVTSNNPYNMSRVKDFVLQGEKALKKANEWYRSGGGKPAGRFAITFIPDEIANAKSKPEAPKEAKKPIKEDK